MRERYVSLFAQLKERKEAAFDHFVTLGDPGIEQSLKIIDTLIEAGADALELGIPFSDPLADGPTIQNATLRAFAAGVTPAQGFEMLARIAPKTPAIPFGLLLIAIGGFKKHCGGFFPGGEKGGG
ncbi:tryptophan synthase subunit alpha, partial [Escherichia coli]|nr:tryptophan synthase subunit alpha [Escherichia coli]